MRTRLQLQGDEFSPSRGVRRQYSLFDEEAKKNTPMVLVTRMF